MSKTIIIAEAGVNHNGSIELAKKLIDAAIFAGVDIVKFQLFNSDLLVTKTAVKARYQSVYNEDADVSQYLMLKKLELDEASHLALYKYCNLKGIQFLSSGFDNDSVDFLNQLNIPFFKIPSGEITNKPYLQHIARKGKAVVMSTGMASMNEVESGLRVLLNEGLERDKITVLHCNSEYPTPMKDVNLKAMQTIKEVLKVKVGYSDHTNGIEVPIAAVALGASIIEKHFTIDRKLSGPDHKASLEPVELKAMVQAIRNIEKVMSGNGLKVPSPSEAPNIIVVRKSIHYASSFKKGHIIQASDLVMKRPGLGVAPMEYESFIGKVLKVNVERDRMLQIKDFE